MALPPIAVALLPLVEKIVGMIPDPEARARAQRELTAEIVRIEAEQAIAQVELNKQEAQHSSIFVAGWRPFIGWVGGVSLAWTFLVHPLLVWVATVSGYTGTFPALDTDPLMTLVFAMLGVGVMRTVDKIKGVDTKTIGAPKPEKKPTYNN
jgi:hypothetical protein